MLEIACDYDISQLQQGADATSEAQEFRLLHHSVRNLLFSVQKAVLGKVLTE